MEEKIRVGVVSDVDEENGTVRVTYSDKDHMVSADLRLLSGQQRFPEVGKMVITITLENGIEEGFCLGEYFNDDNLPPTQKKDEIVIDFDGARIISKVGSGEITISADKIILDGKVDVTGELTENGRRVQLM